MQEKNAENDSFNMWAFYGTERRWLLLLAIQG
jgi:hypothetical protein